MSENLKRKIPEESISKKRFLESLRNLEKTPPKKRLKNKKLVELVKNSNPSELFQSIFDKKSPSSSVSLKKQNRSNTPLSSELQEKKQNNSLIGKIFSKLASIPERKIEFIENPQTPIEEPKFLEANLPETIEPYQKSILERCCTPLARIIKIPESYVRQRPVKIKSRIPN